MRSIAIAALLACALALWLGFLALPILGIVGLVEAARRNCPGMLVATGAAIVALARPGIVASAEYAEGTARLEGHGLATHDGGSGNLDRDLRCRRSSMGCCRDPISGTSAAIHNAVLRTMVALFGPMRGSYTGEYPTRWEALLLLRKEGTRVPIEALRARGLAEALYDSDLFWARTAITARIGDCLVVGLESTGRDSSERWEAHLESITLVDIERKAWFACYHRF